MSEKTDVCARYILGASFQLPFTLSQLYHPCKKEGDPRGQPSGLSPRSSLPPPPSASHLGHVGQPGWPGKQQQHRAPAALSPPGRGSPGPAALGEAERSRRLRVVLLTAAQLLRSTQGIWPGCPSRFFPMFCVRSYYYKHNRGECLCKWLALNPLGTLYIFATIFISLVFLDTVSVEIHPAFLEAHAQYGSNSQTLKLIRTANIYA